MEPDQREQRIRQLEARLRALEEHVGRQERAIEESRAQAAAAPPPLPPAASPFWAVPPEPPAAWQPLPPLQARAARPAPKPVNVENLLGANWLARAGILVLAIGVVFFLKLAYDRGWVPIPGRFAIGTLGGLALFALGDLLRKRRIQPVFLHILSGGGAAITYITIYVAYVLPEYRVALGISLAGDVVMLASISLLLGGYAAWRNVPTLAGLSLVLSGILLAPAGDLSSLSVVVVGLLCTAMLAAAIWRKWHDILLSSAFVANVAFLIAAAGLGRDVDWGVLAACAFVVNAAVAMAAHRAQQAGAARRAVTCAAASLALFILLGLSFASGRVGMLDGEQFAKPWALAAAVVAVLGLGTALASRRLAPALGVAGAVATLAWPLLQLDSGLAQGWAYAVFGGVAAATSLALPRAAGWMRLGATAALALGMLALNSQDARDVRDHAVESGLLAVALLAVGGLLWILGRRAAARLDAADRAATNGARLMRTGPDTAGMALLPLVILAIHAVTWPHRQFEGSLWAAFTLGALAAGLLAAQAAWREERRTLGLLGAALAGSALLSMLWLGSNGNVLRLEPFASTGVAVMLAGVGALTYALHRGEPKEDPLRIAGVALAAAAPMIEVAYLLSGWQITVAWAAEGLALAVLGLWLRGIDIRIASFALFGAVLLRVFTIDFSTLDVVSRVLAFIFTGAILLLGAFLYARQRAGPGGAGPGPGQAAK